MHLKQTLFCATLAISVWAQAPAADPSKKVVATIAGKDITAADIQQLYLKFSPQDIQMFEKDPQNILSQYYLFVHLADEAEKSKLLEKSPYKEQYEGLKLQLLRNARLNDENNSFPVSAEAIDAYYQKHSAEYEQAKIKVIYISYAGQVGPHSSDEDAAKNLLKAAQAKRSEEDARKLAEDIVTQLRGGADFAKLVQQYSEDPASKAAGGDFGIIKASSEYPAELKSAVFALKAGETGALRQPTAYYIIRVEEKGAQPINEVREPIVTALRNEHMNQWMKDLTASYQAVIKDPDFFKAGAAAPPIPLTITPPKR